MSSGLPVMLNVAGKTCIVVGGGHVAARKVASLLNAEAQVTVISPEIVITIKNLLQHIRWQQQTYAPGMIESYRPTLVFAATSDPETNQQVAYEALTLGVLVNVADAPDESSFTSMTALRRPPLTIALHTGGASPALARHLHDVLETAVGNEYAVLAHWMSDLRITARKRLDTQAQRQQLYEAVLKSDILALLRQQQTDRARQRFEMILLESGIES
jgi:precorrin-2 dehydrogenase/sirohydrochlorin ferrochelatase